MQRTSPDDKSCHVEQLVVWVVSDGAETAARPAMTARS
jgi:hypothetical protein